MKMKRRASLMFPVPHVSQVVHAVKAEFHYHQTVIVRSGKAAIPRKQKSREQAARYGEDRDATVSFLLTNAVYHDVLTQLGRSEPESMGVLLGPKTHHRLVTHFVLDPTGAATPVSFTIDKKRLQPLLRPYIDCRLDIKGYAHSHPGGISRPSSGDERYLRELFAVPANRAVESFFFPIICDRKLYPYAYLNHGSWGEIVNARIAFI